MGKIRQRRTPTTSNSRRNTDGNDGEVGRKMSCLGGEEKFDRVSIDKNRVIAMLWIKFSSNHISRYGGMEK